VRRSSDNILLQRLYGAMQKRANELANEVNELRDGIEAIQANLDRFEDIRPTLSNLLGRASGQGRHAVTHRMSENGNAVEFIGYGQIRKVTIDDLAKLPREERRIIAASDAAMRTGRN
jgi:hypothetical protein